MNRNRVIKRMIGTRIKIPNLQLKDSIKENCLKPAAATLQGKYLKFLSNRSWKLKIKFIRPWANRNKKT